MIKKSLLATLMLIPGLLFGGHLYAQNIQKESQKIEIVQNFNNIPPPYSLEQNVSDNSKTLESVKTEQVQNAEQNSYQPTLWDLNLVSPANPITEISRDKGFDFYKAIQRAPNEFPTKDYAVSGKAGLERILGYLESPEGKNLYKDPSSLQFETSVYKSTLDSINGEDETSQSYKDSLSNLSRDVKFGDGKVTPEQLKAIDEGHYTLVEEGIRGGDINNRYSYVVPVYIGPKEEKIAQKNIQKTTTFPKPVQQGGVDLILGMNTNSSFNFYDADLGLRFHPFKNKAIGIGTVGSVGFSSNKQLASVNNQYYDSVLNATVSMQGSKVKTNSLDLGLYAEASYSFPGFILSLGGGVEYQRWIEKSTEEISLNGQVVNSNILSEPYSDLAIKSYIAGEFSLSGDLSLGGVLSYSNAKGVEFGPRMSIKLGK